MRGHQVFKLLILICWIGDNVIGGSISTKSYSVSAVAADKPSTAADYNAPDYNVKLITLNDRRGFKMQITGKGIKDEIYFHYDEDVTSYKSKNFVTIGNSIYSFEPNSLIIMKNNRCVERKYSEGKVSQVIKIKPSDCVEIKKKMEEDKDGVFLENDDSFQYNDDKKQEEEEEVEEEEEEKKVEEEEDTDDGDYIDITATNVNIPRYYVKNWIDIYDNGRVDIYGKGIMESLFINTYTMHSDKDLFVGRSFYSGKPNSLIAVSGGSCVERKYKNGVLITRTPVAAKECTRVKKALHDAFLYIKSGAWKTDGKGNIVKNFH